jgi:hypothetical protein
MVEGLRDTGFNLTPPIEEEESSRALLRNEVAALRVLLVTGEVADGARKIRIQFFHGNQTIFW